MTIPNMLSIFRIILIPFFAWSFLSSDVTKFSLLPLLILVLSGLTDMVDGYIARRFNQISDLGQFLDPCADKLTQAAVCACIMLRYPQLVWLLVIYVVKELIMTLGGIKELRKGQAIPPAQWYGKLSTLELYTAMGLFLLIPDMPDLYVNLIMIVTIALVLFALVMYMIHYYKLLKGKANGLQQM